MGKVIVVSTGTGKDVEHGIAKAINDCNPNQIIFMITEESKDTVALVQKLLNSEYPWETATVTDKDDFERCYVDARNILMNLLKTGYSATEIIIDFTSGTKAMSAGLVLAAISLECNTISYVCGKRDNYGRVITGTERRMTLTPTEIVADSMRKQAVQFFNRYQYDACLNIIRGVKALTKDNKVLEKFDSLEILAQVYSAFDKFDHQIAMDYLKKLDKELGINTYDNKVLLHMEIVCKKYCAEQIADLIENAKRRGIEGKFDDAVARLYRVIELIAQLRLWSEHNIDASDVDINRLPKMLKGKYEVQRNHKGVISVGLRKAYKLLEDLDDPTGKAFAQNKKLLEILDMRNYSILAHGTRPISCEQYEKALELVENFALTRVPDLQRMLNQAKFPEVKE